MNLGISSHSKRAVHGYTMLYIISDYQLKVSA